MSQVSAHASVVEKLQFGFRSKLPMQRQAEAGECGLSCLSMIATFHGYHTDLATLRRQFPLSLKGATVQQLAEISTAIQLAPRALRIELDELSDLVLPCILHWDLDHFVVLKEIRKGRAIIHDPARGVRSFSMEELSPHFTGVALELTPLPGFKRKQKPPGISLRAMLKKVVGLKRSVGQILLLALVLELVSLLSPLFNQWVIDHAILTGDLDLLLVLAIGFGLLKVTTVSVEAFRSWAVMVMSTSLNVQWLANLFLHLLALPVSFFEKRHMGDVVSRFNSIHAIQSTLTTSFIGAILDGFMAIGSLTMMVIYSPRLTVVALVAIVLYVLLRACFYASLMAATESQIVHDAQQQSIFMETVRGIQSLRLFSKEKDRFGRWINVVVMQKNAGLRTQRLMIVFQAGNGLLFGIEGIVVMALGAESVIGNVFSVGMLMAFMSYKMQFSTRVSSLVDKFFELNMIRLQGARLSDIALAEPEHDTRAFAHELQGVEPSVEVKSLAFSYGVGEKPVFSNLNFKVAAGESVVIVGPSGCGKTTLMKVLLGIHRPAYGDIHIGGISLQQIGHSNYRQLVGSVMQEDTLFAGTISENISFFAEIPDQEWVEECARMAAIHKEILGMPMGYNTMVGDMGSALSSGQKQRLLLARALYARPKILFLDEATSHLDSANEAIVSEAVQALSITRIIVAHRPETIQRADRTIYLGGRANGLVTQRAENIKPVIQSEPEK